MLVHVLADTSDKLFGLCSVLERQFTVAGERLDVEAKLPHAPAAVVIRAALRSVENIAALKRRALRLAKAGKRIFLVEQTSHVCISQAYALGATLVLPGKIDPTKLMGALSDPAGSEARSPCDISQPDDAVEIGANAIASLFTLVTLGERIDVDGTKEAGRMITNRISEHGLSEWLKTVRRHHEGTYQHCLLVTGIAIDFGLSLGVRKSDLERLSTAAMFHDIGKARIPLAILDKPGRLDNNERALVETHPAVGYDVLKEHGSISSEILDCVRHHHEYLDGSGYPDGLCAENITDIVRILTISDIFAALIEHRQYKPTMPREAAYGILCGMNGKLEKALVSSFKEVALTR
ncbi:MULTISPECIES: HD domain-containing phosphohydrolase [unclassified Bradyrhizobium]|uniref:HD-GYP domain-containing protein n=1 Tax=unclassified Bradyrhizobium TaxID=2631580 RepID=UPI001FF8FE35|nr:MULTISPECIES: HD domain-containing phosphohydrolase [unclassified Bradyrhizobium]MCK1293940.1 HD domain-containing protein [Bradyrhizobium sp. 30]MCK1346423.1 HD domain-containing protein [Bradyrhizobium sp. CW11]MCK1353424.1 HD domain-containing protein [Bradyrhizobium sp. CW7]MCK1509443.1 HD domain-containing protein [Bradyrhizobium sp. 18]